MEGETSTLANLLAWLPLVVILAAVWFFARSQNRKYAKHVDDVNEINERILEANEKMLEALQDIKAELKRRPL